MGKTVAAMARAFQSVDLIEETKKIISADASKVEDLNREQLLRGLDADGKYLSPKYSEDPYFKTKEAALKYANWKDDISPVTDRPKDVPNLYITGRYHSSITAKITGNKLELVSNDPNAGKIRAKFKNTDGLTDESIQKYRKETLYPGLIRVIVNKTGAGTGKS